MASVYGSSLDSLMQNEMAQKAASQAEANSYRNFLNQTANTNLRRREGDSMDRYRMGDIDVRREDVGGMNEFRRGQIGIGQQDAGTRRFQAETGREDVTGLNDLRRGQVEIGKTDAGTRREDVTGMNTYRGGLIQRELDRIQSNERLGMEQNQTSRYGFDRGVDTTRLMTEAQKYGFDRGVDTARINSDTTRYGFDTQGRIASLPYDRLTAPQQKMYEQYGAAGLRPQDPNLQALQMSNQQEQESAFQNALNEQARRNLDELNGFDFWDSKRKDKMQEYTRAGMSPEGAARKLAVDELTPLYGRSSAFTGSQRQQPNPPQGGGGTNSVPTEFRQTQGGARFRIVPTQPQFAQ